MPARLRCSTASPAPTTDAADPVVRHPRPKAAPHRPAGFGPAILADTVGFISHLPHQLVEAFKATLEETVAAQLLVHVVDAADARRGDRIEQVQRKCSRKSARRRFRNSWSATRSTFALNSRHASTGTRKGAPFAYGCQHSPAPARRNCAAHSANGSDTTCSSTIWCFRRARPACAPACWRGAASNPKKSTTTATSTSGARLTPEEAHRIARQESDRSLEMSRLLPKRELLKPVRGTVSAGQNSLESHL